MALIKCSECNNEVSDKAKACPHCGNPELAQSDIGSRALPDDKIYLDKDGNPREPYDWELGNAKSLKEKIKENWAADNAKANAPMSGTKMFGVIVGSLFFFFIILPILFWIVFGLMFRAI